MGALFIIIVLLLPHGIGGFIDIALRRHAYGQRRTEGAEKA
jgi:hypothetical protein